MPAPRIYSVGHSTDELDELVKRVRAFAVDQVVDVRRYPGSRRLPWFNSDALSRELPQRALLYAHLAELGGRRRPSPDSPNGGWNVEAFRGYADHMAGADFAAGLEALEELARRRATAMMCAEGLWWRCHRRLVSDALMVRGWEVIHIGVDGRATRHELTPFAITDSERLTYPPTQTSLGSGAV